MDTKYRIVGRRPVKLVMTESGGGKVLVWDWGKREFVVDPTYLTRVLMPDAETEIVDEREFERRVAALR
jgi:hypothetical protein